MNNKFKLIKLDRNKLKIIGVILLLLTLPLILSTLYIIQNTRSSAAAPDKLETEGGTLSSTGVSKQSDSGASGGQFIVFTSTQTNTPTPVPTTPPAASTGTYSPGVDMDSKNNQQIGTSNNYQYSIKFRANHTSQVTGFRLQWRSGPVYSGTTGNYGIIRISIRPDNGSGFPSNTILASVDVNPANLPSAIYNGSFIRTTNFPNPPSLTTGSVYHFQLENVHSNPSTSYISISSAFTYNTDTAVLGRHTPHFRNEDYGLLRRNGSTGSWSAQNRDSPALDIIYANGGHDGFAYQSIASAGSNPAYPMPLIGGNNMIRERFTVQGGNKTVTRLWARIGRISGSSNAVLSLDNSNGSVIEQGQAAGSGSIPTIPLEGIENSKGTWVSYTLSQPRTLVNG